MLAHLAMCNTLSAACDELQDDASVLECVQTSGDILFVPFSWAHSTLNVETSVGIAYEFDYL